MLPPAQISLKFGEREVQDLYAAWGVSLVWTALIFDPCNICIVTIMPYLVHENTRCGRACGWMKYVYDELFAP